MWSMVVIPVTRTLHLDQATQVMQVAAMLAREWEAVLCGHLAHVGRHHRVTQDMVGDYVKDHQSVGLHLHRSSPVKVLRVLASMTMTASRAFLLHFWVFLLPCTLKNDCECLVMQQKK